MTLRRSAFFLILVGCASSAKLGCASSAQRNEQQSSAASSKANATPTHLQEMIARQVVTSGEGLRSAEPIGGFIQINDDQTRNSHFVAASFFRGTTTPSCESSALVEDGVKCVLVQSCGSNPGDVGDETNPDGGFNLPPTVGDIVVSATFDTVRLQANLEYGYYPAVMPSGPFWNGDGDWVGIAFEGKADVVPPFSHRMPAPVPDAVMRLPPSADRNVPLVLDWQYAVGSAEPTGYMTVELSRIDQGPPPGEPTPPPASVLCGAPAAKGSIRIPPSMLAQLPAGQTFTRVKSTTEERYVVDGSLTLNVDLTATVDTGPFGSGSFGTFIELR